MTSCTKNMGLLSIRRENDESFSLRHESYVLVILDSHEITYFTNFVLGKVFLSFLVSDYFYLFLNI